MDGAVASPSTSSHEGQDGAVRMVLEHVEAHGPQPASNVTES
jgi:hypothetical protein